MLRPWADLLGRHREQWVASLGGEDAVMWFDDYTDESDTTRCGRPSPRAGRSWWDCEPTQAARRSEWRTSSQRSLAA